MSKRKQWTGRLYIGRDPATGKQNFEWVGRFDTKRERNAAVAEARRRRQGGRSDLPTCDAFVDRYLADYERRPMSNGKRRKDSSVAVQNERLKRFREDFAGRPLDVSRAEIKDWINGEGAWSNSAPVPPGFVAAVVSLFNFAIDDEDLPLDRNPARKLSTRSKGRAELPPPTDDEFGRLLDACSAMGDYAPTMRALMNFAAFTLMRPSELYALEWSDVDFKAMRIEKARRLYQGKLDLPKTGAKQIALTPPARDAIMALPRADELIFHSKTGRRLSQATMSGYWGKVQARACLEFDFYHATKHYGVHYMWTKLGMSDRAIAAQAGWSISTVAAMLATYGHGDVGALDEVDAAFSDQRPNLRVVGGSDA